MKRALVLLALGMSWVVSGDAARADTVLQCAVGQIPIADLPALDSTVGCRVYQASGPVTTINANTPACTGQRCIRTFSTNALFGGAGFGGYNCNQESTGVYGPPATEPSNQTYYCLIDAEASSGACNHIGYYAVSGQSANNLTTDNAGDARAAACAGTVTQNCFTRADSSNSDPTPLLHTYATYGPAPHQIRSIGGFSPVPTARPGWPGDAPCDVNHAPVRWDDPISADPTMKNGVSSPILGVALYVNSASCGACPNDQTGWVRASGTLSPTGEYGPSAGPIGDCIDITGLETAWFALTVRVKGPGPDPSSYLETRLGANSQCLGVRFTAARIVSLAARYMGHGTVQVRWTTGTEGGIEGFAVTRATSPSGPFMRVSGVIPATGDGTAYAFTDSIRPSSGRQLMYRIEAVLSDGTIERSGTAAVTVPGPKVKKLSGD